jgi:hypothetical protein
VQLGELARARERRELGAGQRGSRLDALLEQILEVVGVEVVERMRRRKRSKMAVSVSSVGTSFDAPKR